MWRLFAASKTASSEDGTSSNNAIPNPPRCSAAQLRVLRDLQELSLPNTCKIEFPDPDNLLQFVLTICPDEGYYRNGNFQFEFNIGDEYPHVAPKIKCLSTIFHPNIDLEGNICLNILRDEWKPVLCINSVVYGLQHLLLEPNPDDALNKDAADLLRMDSKKFANMVRYSMRNCSTSKNAMGRRENSS